MNNTKQIAKHLGISESAVEKYLSRMITNCGYADKLVAGDRETIEAVIGSLAWKQMVSEPKEQYDPNPVRHIILALKFIEDCGSPEAAGEAFEMAIKVACKVQL